MCISPLSRVHKTSGVLFIHLTVYTLLYPSIVNTYMYVITQYCHCTWDKAIICSSPQTYTLSRPPYIDLPPHLHTESPPSLVELALLDLRSWSWALIRLSNWMLWRFRADRARNASSMFMDLSFSGRFSGRETSERFFPIIFLDMIILNVTVYSYTSACKLTLT